MSNFGFTSLRVVNPYEVAFREARSARGGSGVLAQAREFGTLAEAVADCKLVVGTTAAQHRELQQPLRPLLEGARLIRSRLSAGPAALVFGSEKYGLSNQQMSHCQWLLRIPTREASGSMNLGQAVAVCLYELARGAGRERTARQENRPPAAQLERMTLSLCEALLASGYVNPSSVNSIEERVRRMVRRMQLPPEDCEIWLGMLRQINWKLRTGTKLKE